MTSLACIAFELGDKPRLVALYEESQSIPEPEVAEPDPVISLMTQSYTDLLRAMVGLGPLPDAPSEAELLSSTALENSYCRRLMANAVRLKQAGRISECAAEAERALAFID